MKNKKHVEGYCAVINFIVLHTVAVPAVLSVQTLRSYRNLFFLLPNQSKNNAEVDLAFSD